MFNIRKFVLIMLMSLQAVTFSKSILIDLCDNCSAPCYDGYICICNKNTSHAICSEICNAKYGNVIRFDSKFSQQISVCVMNHVCVDDSCVSINDLKGIASIYNLLCYLFHWITWFVIWFVIILFVCGFCFSSSKPKKSSTMV